MLGRRLGDVVDVVVAVGVGELLWCVVLYFGEDERGQGGRLGGGRGGAFGKDGAVVRYARTAVVLLVLLSCGRPIIDSRENCTY